MRDLRFLIFELRFEFRVSSRLRVQALPWIRAWTIFTLVHLVTACSNVIPKRPLSPRALSSARG
jgi:hypothetical protein